LPEQGISIKNQTQAPKRPDSPLKALQRQLRELKKKQKELENNIEQAELRINELTTALADEENYRNGTAGELAKEYDCLSANLNISYAEWESACNQAADLEAEILIKEKKNGENQA